MTDREVIDGENRPRTVFTPIVLGGGWEPHPTGRSIHTTMPEQTDEDTTLPEVDFLNWANDWVGKECLRCETEVTYTSQGMASGQSQHRIECDCTVIESAAK